jgi:hypothetical protein
MGSTIIARRPELTVEHIYELSSGYRDVDKGKIAIRDVYGDETPELLYLSK